jgi:hypothetical protein
MNGEILKNSFLFMYEREPIADFLKDCEIYINKQQRGFGLIHEITFTVPATVFKKYEESIPYFQAKLKEDFHRFHQLNHVIVYLTADWAKLEIISTRVVSVPTAWEEINNLQNLLLSQLHTATETISFQNIGNSSRHLLRKLADTVFDEKKLVAKQIVFETSPENFKNRLWSFVLFSRL